MEKVSLSDIAGVLLDDVKEVRFSLPYEGIYIWDIKEAELSDKEVAVEEGSNDKCQLLLAGFKLSIANVISLKDKANEAASADMIGKTFTFSVAKKLKNPAEDFNQFLGLVKAFLSDIGVKEKGGLGALMTKSQGRRFKAPFKHVKNPNDADRPNGRLVTDRIEIVA